MAITCRTDVARREDLDRLVGSDTDEFSQLDVLVSNAGISKIGPISDLGVDGWSAMIDVNLRGVLHGRKSVESMGTVEGDDRDSVIA